MTSPPRTPIETRQEIGLDEVGQQVWLVFTLVALPFHFTKVDRDKAQQADVAAQGVSSDNKGRAQ